MTREPSKSSEGDGMMEPEQSGFQFGRRALNDRGYECCGKPQGCTMTHEGCAYLKHPYKRFVRGEITLAQLVEATAGRTA